MIAIECIFPMFFSYRVPDFSSQYALSSLFPGPSTVKLGLVATAIEYFGLKKGIDIFYKIKKAKVGVIPPKTIIVNNFLIKRLKAKKDFNKYLEEQLELLKSGKINFFETFETTYGIRGYVQFSEPLKIVLETDSEDEIKEIARYLSRLGSYDSLTYCTLKNEVDKDKIIWAVSEIKEEDKNLLLIPVKDLKQDISFNDINPFSHDKKGRKKVMERKYYLVPIKWVKTGKNWSVYYIGK